MREGVCPLRRMWFSFESRCRIVVVIEGGISPQAAAAACGASRATGYRLWRRYQQGGWSALADRPSTPIRQPRRLSRSAEQEILACRAELNAGPAVIATVVGRPASTVGKLLRRAGCFEAAARPAAIRASALSVSDPANCSTSTRTSSAASGRSANGSAPTGFTGRPRPAGSTCTSLSTTTRGLPTPRCPRQSAGTTAPPSSAAQSPATPSTESGSNA